MGDIHITYNIYTAYAAIIQAFTGYRTRPSNGAPLALYVTSRLRRMTLPFPWDATKEENQPEHL